MIEISQQGKTEQVNINDHSQNEFQTIAEHGLKHGGIHTVASKGHGKTRLLFNMAKTLMEKEDCRVLIFDGSEAWLYGFSQIPVFTIKERDIQLLKDVQTTEDIERYEFQNWNLVKLALETHKDILFRLKSRKPSKRGFAIRKIICHLDLIQRQEREITPNHEPKQKIAYFIEEVQDAFNVRATLRLEAEEFLTVFNEGRNHGEGYFTCSQREFDTAKTLRVKQLMAYGKIPECDKSAYHRRLEKMYSVDFSKLPQRNWFFEGATFVSPEWKQEGKPYQINKEIKQSFIANLPQPQKHGILARIANFFSTIKNPELEHRPVNQLIKKTENSEETDRSIYSDEGTEEEDMEEDLGLLDDEDMLW